MTKLTVLFDDERSFNPGFRDDAVILRTVHEATEFFANHKGQVIDELWLDYVLSPGDTTEALHALKGVDVKEIYFHSSAYAARGLVEFHLGKAEITTPVELHDQSVFLSPARRNIFARD